MPQWGLRPRTLGRTNPVENDKQYELARMAYAAYGSHVGWKNFQGDRMPYFEDLTPTIKEAWQLAAEMVVKYVMRAKATTEGQHYDDDPERRME